MKREEFVNDSGQTYRILSYLRSTNASGLTIDDPNISYIDTNLKLTENYLKLICKMRFVNGIYGSILSGRDANRGFQLQGIEISRYTFRLYNGKTAVDAQRNSVSKNIDYDIELICNGGNISLTYNDKSYTTSNSNLVPITSTQNLGMFASIRNDGIASSSNLRIYYLKLYNSSNVCLRDFCPMLRLIDNKPGMFDYITNEFYTQANPNAPEFEYE